MAVVIPNWLRGADVIGSASAGANVGLAARARDLQAAAQQQEAEQFIARLNQQASQFDRNLKSEQDIAAARLAQALRQQNALDVYRKGMLDVREQEAETRAARLLQEGMDFNPEFMDVEGGRVFQRGPKSFQFIADPTAAKASVRTAAQWNSYIDDLAKDVEGESPEAGALRLRALDMARKERDKLMLPQLPATIPQITPGTPAMEPWFGRNTPAVPPTTNWVADMTSGRTAPSVSGLPPITATNPQTGERVIFRNGKWEPLTQ